MKLELKNADGKWEKIDEALPLKQGLKHRPSQSRQRCIRIDEALPLKQGLKQESGGSPLFPVKIDEALPLKQGLKLKGLKAYWLKVFYR